jgi:hypothetical protein
LLVLFTRPGCTNSEAHDMKGPAVVVPRLSTLGRFGLCLSSALLLKRYATMFRIAFTPVCFTLIAAGAPAATEMSSRPTSLNGMHSSRQVADLRSPSQEPRFELPGSGSPMNPSTPTITVPSPGAVALLGFAGLMVPRRRFS